MYNMDFMMILTNILIFLEEVNPNSIGSGLKGIGAGIAVFTGVGSGIGEGNVAAHAMDAMARQPEIAGKISTSMLIGQAVAETTGLYGLLIAIMLVI
jgi:F-type H+-transporting ATPase subunit c